jgi:hypothetical protein
MTVQERTYNVYIANDGKEFESESACKHHEEDVRLYKKFTEFEVDRTKLQNYTSDNWEHLKWWFLRLCQPGEEQHPQHRRRESNELYRMEEFYDKITSEEALKEVILNTLDADNDRRNRNKKISLSVKSCAYGTIGSSVDPNTVKDIYLTLFYPKTGLLHNMDKKGEHYLDWYIRLCSNKSSNIELLNGLKDISLSSKSLLHAITDSFKSHSQDRGYKETKESPVKYGDEVIYRPNNNKEISNEGRIIYYLFNEEKDIIDSMIQKYITDGGDVDDLIKKAFLRSFSYGHFNLDHGKQTTNLFHYILDFTKGKVKSYWHNNTIKDIYLFNQEIRKYSLASNIVKAKLDKNIINIFIEYFNNDKMRLNEEKFVKRLTQFMNEEEIFNLIIKSNGVYLKDTSYYKHAQALFDELVDEYTEKGLIIKGREICTYSSDKGSYFEFTPAVGMDREEYCKNLINNGAYTKEVMRLTRYKVTDITYAGEKAKLHYISRIDVYPVYKKTCLPLMCKPSPFNTVKAK